MQASGSSYPYPQYPRPTPPRPPNSANGYIATGNGNAGAQRRPVIAKPTPTNGEGSRDSNALRASVLDAALALGFGTNKTVENWMFNTVAEEDEEEEDIGSSPALTNGSTATSADSTPGPSTSGFPTPTYTQPIDRPFQNAGSYTTPYPAPVSPPVAPPTPKGKNKLRKKARGDDGYISDSTGPAPLKSTSKSKRNKSKGPAGGGDSSDEGGGYFSDFARRRKSKKKEKKDKDKVARELPDDGEESDGGYLSEATKKKRGFFRLKSKSSKTSPAAPPPVPAMPPKLPSMPTSASTLSADIEWERRESVDRARSTTPMAAVRPKESFDSFATMTTSTEDEDAWTAETPNTSMSGHGLNSSIGHGSKRSNDVGSSSHGHESSNGHGAGSSEGLGEPAKKGVRFTPSTRFSGPALQAFAPSPESVPPSPSPRVPALPISPSPAISQRQQLMLNISPPYALAPKPAPSPTPSDFTIVSATEGVEPSSDYLVPSPSVTPVPAQRSPDDALTPQSGSDTISPQSTYIVPSPSAPNVNFRRDSSPPRSAGAGYIVPSPSTPTFSHAYQSPSQRGGYTPYSRGRTPEPRDRSYTPDPDYGYDDGDDDRGFAPPSAPHLRLNVNTGNASPTRGRFSHADLPPATPPPVGPLPDVPPGEEVGGGNSGSGFRFPPPSPSMRDVPRGRSPLMASYSPTPPSAYAPSPSTVAPSAYGQPSSSSRPPSRAPSPGPILRGRESPFPVRPARPIIAVSAPAEDEPDFERGRNANGGAGAGRQMSAGVAGQWSAARERERFLAATGGRESPMAPGPSQTSDRERERERDGALLSPSSSVRRKPTVTLVNHRAELSLQALVYPEGSGEGRVTSAIVPESVTGFSDSDAGGVRESAYSDGDGDGGLGYLREGGRESEYFDDEEEDVRGRSESAYSSTARTYGAEQGRNARESTLSMSDALEYGLGRESTYDDGRAESVYDVSGALRAGAYDDGAQDPRALFGRESVYDDDASIYPPSQRTVDSYYFGDGASRPASLVDEQRSGEMRSKLMQRVGRGDEVVPPVPPLPRGANRAAARF